MKKGSLSFEYWPEDMYFSIGMYKLNYNVALDKFATNFCTHTIFLSQKHFAFIIIIVRLVKKNNN